MSQNKTTTRNHKKKARKPIRLAKRWGSEVLPMAGKILGITVAIAVMGLMFSALQAVDFYWLRVIISAAIAGGMLLMLYAEGLSCGVLNVTASRQYVQAETDGRRLTAKEDAACYHPIKALCACLTVYCVPLALSVYLAANAQDYAYTLQSLPAWLTDAYGVRGDVLAPLAAYAQERALTAMDVIRMFVRLFELVFINFFSDPQKMTGMIDRLSPLMMTALPAAYMAGYLMGPARSAKIQRQNRRAKKVAVRKAQRSKVADELLHNPKQVHYGHRVKEEKHRKKELV